MEFASKNKWRAAGAVLKCIFSFLSLRFWFTEVLGSKKVVFTFDSHLLLLSCEVSSIVSCPFVVLEKCRPSIATETSRINQNKGRNKRNTLSWKGENVRRKETKIADRSRTRHAKGGKSSAKETTD